MIVAVLCLAVGMSLAGCDGNRTPAPSQQPPTGTPLPPPVIHTTPGDGNNPGSTPTPRPLTPVPTPNFSDCFASHDPNDPNGQYFGITGILDVLFYEGASSIPDKAQRTKLLEKELWALRSEKKNDPSNKDISYEQLVQSGKDSAAGRFNDGGTIEAPCWSQDHIQMAEAILYENGGGRFFPEPGFDNGTAIYFISAQHFLRVVPNKGFESFWIDAKDGKASGDLG